MAREAIAEAVERSKAHVSIPKRVSEVLWHKQQQAAAIAFDKFQSLKGFQRFCGFREAI